jgi:uncharacterized protein (TIGR02246 family)
MSSAGEAMPGSVALNTPVTAANAHVIRDIVKAYEAGWNAHDMDALAALFADDVEWINIVGMWWRGRGDVRDAHIGIHATVFKDVGMRVEDCVVRFVGNDLAISVVTLTMGGFTPPDGKYRPPGQDRLTLMMHRREGSWRIVHGHNTPIDVAAQRFDPLHLDPGGEQRARRSMPRPQDERGDR